MRLRITGLLVPLGLSLGSAADAEWRCDCTTVVAGCSAEVSIADTWVDVTSDTPQCSRVDYFIDGRPFVSLVVDGRERQDWITRSESPNVLVQSCQVCRDNAGVETPRPPPTADSDAGLEPLIEVAPTYPQAAQARGLEGYVEVSFTVDPLGDVQDTSVAAAEPAGVFDQAALAAVSRWRYPADETREPQMLTTRVVFELDDYILQLARAPEPSSAENRPAGPRNQCVREQAVYNYGEVVEVGLMNACVDPLIVFGCAQGTGQYLGRWVCADSERRQSVLVPQNDGRVGNVTAVETPEGARNFEYTANFFVSRAPNTQYWWLACGENDLQCRENARLWTRSLDRQLASVDPQTRTSMGVSRSY